MSRIAKRMCKGCWSQLNIRRKVSRPDFSSFQSLGLRRRSDSVPESTQIIIVPLLSHLPCDLNESMLIEIRVNWVKYSMDSYRQMIRSANKD
jgi:hypothetical protein